MFIESSKQPSSCCVCFPRNVLFNRSLIVYRNSIGSIIWMIHDDFATRRTWLPWYGSGIYWRDKPTYRHTGRVANAPTYLQRLIAETQTALPTSNQCAGLDGTKASLVKRVLWNPFPLRKRQPAASIKLLALLISPLTRMVQPVRYRVRLYSPLAVKPTLEQTWSRIVHRTCLSSSLSSPCYPPSTLWAFGCDDNCTFLAFLVDLKTHPRQPLNLRRLTPYALVNHKQQ